MRETTDDRAYRVVVNDEGFYSIRLADRPLPAGWHDEETSGPRGAGRVAAPAGSGRCR